MPTAAEVHAERKRRVDAERVADHADLQQYAEGVVAGLGTEWTLTDTSNHQRAAFLLHGPDGVRLRLKRGYNSDFNEAVVEPDSDLIEAAQAHQGIPVLSLLRVDAWRHGTRGIEQMVAEIAGRLLPAHLKQLRAIRAQIAAAQAATAQAQANAAALAAILGGQPRPIEREPEVRLHWAGTSGTVSMRIDAERVHISRADIPVEKFLRIAAILAED